MVQNYDNFQKRSRLFEVFTTFGPVVHSNDANARISANRIHFWRDYCRIHITVKTKKQRRENDYEPKLCELIIKIFQPLYKEKGRLVRI